MDTSELEKRIEALEGLCSVKFFSTLPSRGRKCVLYINKVSGVQYIWDGTMFVSSGSGGGNSIINETHTGNPYTLDNEPILDTLRVYSNGVRLTSDQYNVVGSEVTILFDVDDEVFNNDYEY